MIYEKYANPYNTTARVSAQWAAMYIKINLRKITQTA